MMPALFVGHGSPMNALSNNSWTKTLNKLSDILPRPKAILAISAHWETEVTEVLTVKKPKTIHDFYGFPDQLFQVQYPAPGDLELAHMLSQRLGFHENTNWGLDHGTWSVLTHMYPKADIPVVQLSLSRKLYLNQHFELGQKLSFLRDEGVMILGSGNIVHNLRMLNWQEEAAKPHDWALGFDQKIKTALMEGNVETLTSYKGITEEEWKLSVPTPEHYLPLLYVAGAAKSGEEPRFPFEGFSMAALSMRCVVY